MSDQFSCNVKPVKSGKSAGKKSDYHAREGGYAEKSPDELLMCEAGHIPAVFDSARDLFYSSDKHERKNGARGREVMVALPRELNNDQKKALARDIAATLSQQLASDDNKVLPYQVAIHNNDRNPHAHILYSERMTEPGQQYDDKQAFFKRANPKTKYFRDAGKQDRLVELRETVADVINQHLFEAGISDTWTHLSYAARGIDKQAGRHLGPATAHALKNGRTTKRAEYLMMQPEKPEERLNTAADIADQSAGVVGRYDVGRLEKLKTEAKAAVSAIERPKPTQDDLYRDSGYRDALKAVKPAFETAKNANDKANKAKKSAKDAQREADQLPISYKIGEAIAVWLENKVRRAFGFNPVLTTQQLAAQQAAQAQQLRKQADAKFDVYKAAKSDLSDAKTAVADKLHKAAKAEVTAEFREYLAESKGRQEGFEAMRDGFKIEADKLKKAEAEALKKAEAEAADAAALAELEAAEAAEPRRERSAGLEM